jgi:cytochrome c oxidase subunit IV
MDNTEDIKVVPKPADKAKILKLWKIALILGIVTAIEFFLAIFMPRGIILYSVFIGLTLVKAFYIISEFMHLKYEVKSLIWSIMLPIIFLIWLIIALLAEGSSVLNINF